MTIGQIIAQVNQMKPNAMDEDEKARRLISLDKQLVHEFFPRYEEPGPERWPKKWPEDKTTALVASGPYESLYTYYLMAQIDLFNQEYDTYQADVALFHQAMDDFRKDYHRTHHPKPSGGVRLP